MSRVLLRAIAASASVAVAAAALVVGWAWARLGARYSGWEGEAVTVTLSRGLDAGSMLEELEVAKVIAYPRLLRAWIVLRGGGETLQAGEYRFDRPVSALEVLDKLERGDVLLHAVTLPEGLDLWEVSRRLEEAGIADSEQLLPTLRDPAAIADLDAKATDLEGYLFPDTYHFPRGENPMRIAQLMVERFPAVVGSDYREQAAGLGLTVHEAVTLASMIEKETSVPQERWRISAVFHNRLKRGMKLQCDPTVIYALKREGRVVERLLYRDLEVESAWNTYRVQGLPPGPICSPGRDSLHAAVHPTEGDELYFVAAPEGGHRFSRNLEAHQEAVRDWRRFQRSMSDRSMP